jgi:phosphate uptake regulator
MRMRPEAVNHLAQLLSVSRHLERIADLSTNIAEDVIYMLEGIIVRHRFEDYRRQQEMRVGHGDETGVLRDCERM